MADIGAWSGGQFGERKAEAYVELLIAHCFKIAGGLAHVRSCRDVFAPDLREDGFSRAGQHYILFVETVQDVLVVDFIHQRMNVLGKLRDGLKDREACSWAARCNFGMSAYLGQK